MGRLAEYVGVARTVAHVTHDCQVKYPAAALAYYGFVSFVPLLLFVFAVVGQQFAMEVAARAPRFLTPAARQLVYEALTTASGRAGAVLLAAGVLGWSGANVAVDFLTVVERVEDAPTGSLAEQLRDGVVVLGALSLAIVTIVLTNVLFAGVADGPLGALAEFAVLFLALAVTFVPLYYAPSGVVTSPRGAMPGAVTTAAGWTVLHAAVQFYAGSAAQYAIYGVLSGVIVILTSLYLAAVVLMVGVVVNATLAGGVQPTEGEAWDPLREVTDRL